ncbi:potassium-transporting ATPase subunit KdpC [bacterium]|nr:potassium-transporting ATPase subunit KdpC [bacterium]
METTTHLNGALNQLLASLRLVLVTIVVCCILYPLGIYLFAQLAVPWSAEGSLLRDEQGQVVGSALIAQGFDSSRHFWPRPSAVGYDAAAAGGSNLSPVNPELRVRAEADLARLGGDKRALVPADLATASGSGLDPHITLEAALYQAPRVAAARSLPLEAVLKVLHKEVKRDAGRLNAGPLVNVLLVNLELDRIEK